MDRVKYSEDVERSSKKIVDRSSERQKRANWKNSRRKIEWKKEDEGGSKKKKKLEKGSSLVEVPAAISSAIKEIAGHGKVITRVEIDGIISALN